MEGLDLTDEGEEQAEQFRAHSALANLSTINKKNNSFLVSEQ